MTAKEFVTELQKVLEEKGALEKEYTWDELVADASEIGLEAGDTPEYEQERKAAVKDAERTGETD